MAEQQPELRRLARGGVGGLLAAVVSGFGGLLFITIATKAYSKSEAGEVFTLTSYFLISLAVATLGSETAVARFVAVKHEKNREHIGAVMASILAPVILFSTSLAVVYWFLVPVILDSTSYRGDIAEARLLAVFLPIAAISNLTLAATRGFGNVRQTILIESLLRQGLQPIFALVAVFLDADSFWLIAAWIVPYAASCVGGSLSYIAMCRKRHIAAWVSPRRAYRDGIAGEVWRFNAPRSITQIAQMSIRRADIPLVAAIAGKEAAAIYTAASRFVASGLQGINGIQQMVGPQLARLVATGQNAQAGLTLRAATTWNVLLAWPLYLSCAALPGLVMSLFDSAQSDYSSGESVVVILALGMLIGTAAGPVDIALLMLGRSVQSLRNNMAALLTNLVLNAALIPVWGINGAAFAWSVSILVSNALPTWQIRPYLGSASDRRTAIAAIIALATFGVIPLAARFLTDSLLWQFCSIVFAGLIFLPVVFYFRHTLLLDELLSGITRRRGKGAAEQPAVAASPGRHRA